MMESYDDKKKLMGFRGEDKKIIIIKKLFKKKKKKLHLGGALKVDSDTTTGFG